MGDEKSRRNAMGVDFYNLKFRPDGKNSKYDEEKYLQFFKRYIWENKEDKLEVRLVLLGKFGVAYEKYHNEYKIIVDKVMRNKLLIAEELFRVEKALIGRLTQKSVPFGDRLKGGGLRYEDMPGLGILKPVYQFVYDLSNGKVKVGRCGLEGCENIFLIGSGRYPKQYCSDAHRAKAYRQRQRIASG